MSGARAMTEREGSGFARPVAEVLRMVKIEHTVFALPFAFLGMLLAARGLPGAWTILWIAVCMVTARAAAMAFNRILDRDYDRRNPRTAGRSLPAGRLSVRFAWGFTALMAAGFIASAGMLNRVCLLLSPLALAVILGYSVTKRFTALSHLALGVALSIAPAGAWLAVREDLGTVPVLLSLAVALWVAGFDVLYACQDVEVDRREGLLSLPSRLGVPWALWISTLLHAGMVGVLVALGYLASLGWIYGAGTAVVGVVLGYSHAIVRPGDLSRIETAFFRTNALVGVILLVATWLDLLASAATVPPGV